MGGAVLNRGSGSSVAESRGQENVEVVRRSVAAYNRSDLEALGELNHPDVEVDWSASRGLEAGVYRGREEVTRFHQSFLDTFQGLCLYQETREALEAAALRELPRRPAHERVGWNVPTPRPG